MEEKDNLDRLSELHLEQFRKEGIDYDLKNPQTRWKQLYADLRYIFDSGLPRIWKGKKWGDWTEEDCLRYAGKIIDALRSVYFPLIPPSKNDPRYNTSYWKAYRKAEEKGYVKSKPPKSEELPEWDKKRKEIIKTSLEEAERKLDGLYLTPPHGELFWTDEKKLLVKTKEFDLSKPHYLIEDGYCYGIISFKKPKEITKQQFFSEEFKKKHRILDTEAWQWWRMTRDNAVEPKLYAYEIKEFKPFDVPRRVRVPKGIQVIVKADNIEFVSEDEEKPAKIDWPTMAAKEAKTDFIKFYGTKGYIEEESERHKYHTCILFSLNDTNILLDYGERHPAEIEERVDVVLNSHRHVDHICPETVNFACPLYVSQQTLERVDFPLPEDIRVYRPREPFKIDNIEITAYPVYHSIRAPMHIFKIETDNLAIGVMTDFLGFRDKNDEDSFYPDLDIVIIDGSSITRDLRRWREEHDEPFGHESVIHQIERIRDKCEKNPVIILTHIGNEGLELGDERILELLSEQFPNMRIYVAKDGSIFDLKTKRFTEAFKGEQICKDIVANLPSFTWIPEFVSITGSTLFTKDHAPRDLDVMCKAEEINGKWYIPVDTSLLLKLQRAYQYATKKVLGKAIKADFPPPSLIGPNWCVDDKTEILTKDRGWVLFKDLKESDLVATVSKDDYLEFQKPIRYFSNFYKGKMIHIKNKNIDLLVTPEHKVIYYPCFTRNKKRIISEEWQMIEAQKLLEMKGRIYLKLGCKWKGDGDSIFWIPPCIGYNMKLEPPVPIDMEDFAMFMGWYLSEGSVHITPKQVYSVCIAQYEDSPKFQELKELLSRLPFDFKEVRGNQDNPEKITGFCCKSKQLALYLKQFGKCYDKFIPNEIKNQKPEILKRFLECYFYGDGHLRKRAKGLYVAKTVSERLAGDLQEIGLKLGIRVSYNKEGNGKRRRIYIGNFTLESKWKSKMRQLCRVCLELGHVKEVPYEGMIYAVEVPNGIVIVRRNFRFCVTGNSSIPAYDLKLVPRKNPEVRRTGEEEFEEKVYGVDFKEKLRLRTKSKDIEKMAQQSLEEDKVKPLRFFMPLKPIRVQGKHGERNTPERLVELFEPQHYPVYNSVKRDGFRAILMYDGNKVVIYSEDGNDITDQLPTIVEAIKKLKVKSVILDAEIELWENGQHHPREAAIAKIHSKAIEDENLIANIFDCVYLNGQDLHKEPFEKRWKALNSIGIKYSKETSLDPKQKLNIIPHIPCNTPKELLKETERMRRVKSSEGCVAIAHNAVYPLDGKPEGNSFCKFHNNVVVRGIVVQPVETRTSGVFNLTWGCLAEGHEILKKDQTEVGPYEKVLVIGSTFAAPYVKRGAVIEVECETINHIIHEDIEGKPIEITAWAPRFMRVVPGAKPDSIDDILRKARKENHVLQIKIVKPDGTVEYRESKKELLCFLTEEPTLESQISDRFGAAKYAVFFEPATYHFEAVDLSNFRTGVEIADLIKQHQATKVITNQIGRFSRDELEKAGIEIDFAEGRVSDYLKKELGESPLVKEAEIREQGDPYMQYFDEDKEHRVCNQRHYRFALKDILKETGMEDEWPDEWTEEDWRKNWDSWKRRVYPKLRKYFETHPEYEHSPSTHVDQRYETDSGALIGWTILDSLPDRPKVPPLSLEDAKKFDRDPSNWKIDWNTGEWAWREKKGGAKARISIVVRKKSPEPLDWLTFEGEQPPKSVGATAYGPAIFTHITPLGVVETLSQKSYMHEYYLTFPNFKWHIVFRLLRKPFVQKESFKEALRTQDYERLSEMVELEEGESLEEGLYLEAKRFIPVSKGGWGLEESGWVAIYVTREPYVISKRAVQLKWIPPYPYSALPRHIKKQIPPEYHYWKEKDMQKRIEIRDALVKAIKEKKVVLKESIVRDFKLDFHWSEPAELVKRRSPAHKHWDLRIDGDLKKKTGYIFHAVLELNPLEVDSTSAYLKKCKGDEGGIDWMNVGKEKTVKFTKGPGTFEKNEPGYIRALDWGRVLVLEDSPLFKKFQFKGKKLKGIWIMYRSSPDTDIWIFEKSKNIGK